LIAVVGVAVAFIVVKRSPPSKYHQAGYNFNPQRVQYWLALSHFLLLNDLDILENALE